MQGNINNENTNANNLSVFLTQPQQDKQKSGLDFAFALLGVGLILAIIALPFLTIVFVALYLFK